ncbi:MAG: hypothetical protein HOO96_15370 [Polyangiaceae bacterium]|nr:hypothetical protein [Polyangiaceae bacterium]
MFSHALESLFDIVPVDPRMPAPTRLPDIAAEDPASTEERPAPGNADAGSVLPRR